MTHASELVVLDPLSFPWELLGTEELDLPLVLALPQDLGAEEIELLLTPALTALTPYDAIVEHRADVRARLGRRWGLPPGVWVDVAPPGGIADICAALERRSQARMRVLDTDIGSFESQEGDLITRQLEEFGAHQRGTLNALLALVKPGDVVLDVGAHIGTFAVPVARRVGATGHVICVEGMSEAATLLRRNVRRNDVEERVTVVSAVVSGAREALSGHATFGNTGASSFGAAPWREIGSRQSVTLDDLASTYPDLSRTDVLKLDVEGAELAALRGAESLVAQARPAILLEVSAKQLQRRDATVESLDDWLSAHDYLCLQVVGERNTRQRDWALSEIGSLSEVDDALFDVLAMPKESSRYGSLPRQGSLD
jgi:FkbM family methyltransferase